MGRIIQSFLLPTIILALPVQAQTILRSELNEFRCGLRVQQTAEKLIVKSSGVEYWHVGMPSGSAEGGELVNRENRVYEFSYLESQSKYEVLKGTGILTAPLQPIDCNQFQKHILSFWESAGDSLRLVGIGREGRIASPGRFQLGGLRKSSMGKIYLFTESSNVDAGDNWGTADIYEMSINPFQCDVVYSEGYSWVWCGARSDTLEVSWSSDWDNKLQLIRRVVEGVRIGPGECQSVTLSADTVLVDIEELDSNK